MKEYLRSAAMADMILETFEAIKMAGTGFVSLREICGNQVPREYMATTYVAENGYHFGGSLWPKVTKLSDVRDWALGHKPRAWFTYHRTDEEIRQVHFPIYFERAEDAGAFSQWLADLPDVLVD
jgi:hypothetical protein